MKIHYQYSKAYKPVKYNAYTCPQTTDVIHNKLYRKTMFEYFKFYYLCLRYCSTNFYLIYPHINFCVYRRNKHRKYVGATIRKTYLE